METNAILEPITQVDAYQVRDTIIAAKDRIDAWLTWREMSHRQRDELTKIANHLDCAQSRMIRIYQL